MSLANGGFAFPSRRSAGWLLAWALSQAEHHARGAELATTDRAVLLRRRISNEAMANAVAFASIDPSTLYDNGDFDCRRWRRLP